MQFPSRLLVLSVVGVAALGVDEARGTPFMQIEQIIGGVNGDTSAQAIQLRMRFGDDDLHLERIRAWDAAGENPIILVDFTTSVPSGKLPA